MAKNNKIREEDIIEKEVYQIGDKFGKSLNPANQAILDFEKQWLKSIENIKKSAVSYNKISKEFSNVKTNASFIATKQKEVALTEQTITAYKEQNRTEKALITTIERKKIATESTNKSLIAQRYELQQLNRRSKEAAVLSSKLSTEYDKQSLKLLQLRRSYKDVALSEGEASTKAKQLRAQIIKLDSTLKRVDANVGQYQRSVGNYGKAMQSASGAARAMMSAMGAVGGAYLFVNVMRDAFTRVRAFDKSMQNLAGVLRTNRKELKQVESEIIKVAGASVKTSREVANLAENLATLGKSPEQIVKLLKPINDLSIGLEATSEEAGEFLVQMLNAFGAGDDEAMKYADTIATIRTSTTLDFQKMRDSFQYIAPISKALNKDLAYTGSVVGILADNGLKAESAGRLLATAQQKLAKEGKELTDALNEINQAQKENKTELEVLALASNLFGSQAAKVGVILASNTDAIETNAQAIRDNGGALDDLVNEQLKSLDAKLKIVDSAWEKLILSFDNGEGSISRVFGSLLTFTEKILNNLALINQTQEEFNSGLSNKTFNSQIEYYKELGEEANAYAEIDKENSQKRINTINEELKRLNEIVDNTKTANAVRRSSQNQIERLNNALATQNGILQAAKTQLGEIIEKEKEAEKTKEDLLKTTNDLTEAEKEALKARLDLLKADKFNLNKAELQSEINASKAILENEKSTLLEKQIANIRYYEAREQLLKISKENEISENKGRADKIAEIELKFNDELNAIQDDRKENGIKFLKEQFEAEIKTIKEAQQAKIDALNADIGVEQSKLKSSGQTPSDVETYEQAVLEIRKKYALLEVQVQIDKVKALQKNKSYSVDEQAQLSKMLSDLEIEYSNISTEQIIEDNKKQVEAEEEKQRQLAEIRRRAFDNLTSGLADALGIDSGALNELFASIEDVYNKTANGITGTLQIVSAAAEVTRDIIGSVYQANIDELERQLDASNEYYNAAYERAEGNKIQQDLIREEQRAKEEELNKKIAKEKTKAAKADKAAALIQAGINTALAVTAALATMPFLPLGPIMATLAGILGATQIGLIASKPIPKFKDGHLSGTHQGLAITNDGGRDEVWERNGKAKVIKGRDVPIMMEKGDKIYKSVEDYNKSIRASILASVEIDNNKMKSFQAEKAFKSKLIDEYSIQNAISNGFKRQKVNFHTTNNTKIDMGHELWKLKNLFRD